MKLLILVVFTFSAFAFEFSAEFSLENRYYFEEGEYSNPDQSEISFSGKLDMSHSWDEDRKVVSFIPYLKTSHPDSQKDIFDIRELSFVGSWDQIELRAGISKVFWGVTESLHLVDVINQTDLAQNLDGEQKLGQPMIAPTWVSDYGNITYFFLPYFRERTFTGEQGRFRPALVIDTDNPIFEHEDEERHIDHALRYSHYIGELEFGLSWFKGTDREPLPLVVGGGLRPNYLQVEQYGLDGQYVYGPWLFKLEAIFKDYNQIDSFSAGVSGFEYTFSNIHKGLDIGILYEYLYDERGKNGFAIFNNNSFAGSRFAFNDELGTEFLFGLIYNHDFNELQSFRLEASRRITNDWKWEFELSSIFNTDSSQFIHAFKSDDYAQLRLTKYF